MFVVGSLFSLSREERTPSAALACMETQAHIPWVYVFSKGRGTQSDQAVTLDRLELSY